MQDIIPRKFTSASAIRLVHLSSAVKKRDRREYGRAVAYLRAAAKRVDSFDVARDADDPWYLAASAERRLRRFREALAGADWLCAAYGGTGCADVVRRMTDADLKAIAARRPAVSGYGDAVFLTNYLYFTTGLRTFHAPNVAGLSADGATKTLLSVLRGERDRLAYREDGSRWLTAAPGRPVEGAAIGGSLTAFRDLLDVTEAGPEDWTPYVLFLEDLGVDAEDVHRMLVSLDARGVFAGIRGLVVGRIDESGRGRLRRIVGGAFGRPSSRPDEFIGYVIRDTLADRERRGDPLPILRVSRFGRLAASGSMIVPLGSRAVIGADRTIEFVGPFVA